MEFRDLLYSLLNSGQQRHPGVGGGMPEPVNALAGAGSMPQPAPQNALVGAGASPAPMEPQGAVPAYAAPQPAPQGRSGGFMSGLGDMVQGLVNPGARGRNQTVSWLQQQGLDEGTATLLAGNKPALQQYLLDRAEGNRPEYSFMNIDGTLVRTDNRGNATPVGQFGQPEPQVRPMTPTDRLKWGIPQTDKRPYAMTADGPKLIGGSGVSVNLPGQPTIGTVPQGWAAAQDPETGEWSMAPISGGPAEQDAKAAERAASVRDETKADKAATMLDATGSIRDIITNADTPVTGTLSRPLALYSGTPAGKVRSYVGTLQSGVALGAITRLKEASATGATGFGAMNREELQLLIDDIGALDPDTTEPEIFMKTVDRIERRYKRVMDDVKRNVSPERIQELGLNNLIAGNVPGIGGAPATGSPDAPPKSYQGSPESWKFIKPEDRHLWQ